MNIRAARKLLLECGYERCRLANSHHEMYRHTQTGHTVTISPDFFRGQRRGARWLKALARNHRPPSG